MLIGILSDSHGDARAVRSAMALFDRCGAEYTVHCGDVGGAGVFDEFIGRPLSFVWGNTDCAEHGLLAYLQTVGITVPMDVPTLLDLGGKQIAVFHGHERAFDDAVEALNVDYILHGHTHESRDERVNGTRIINPGALHCVRRKTVATLDTACDRLVFHELAAAP